MLEGYDFVRYGLTRDLFKGSSRNLALYLLKRADFTGLSDEVHVLGGNNLKDSVPLSLHDLYVVLTKAEPGVWGSYCQWCEEYEENQARIDNARGKRY